MLPLLFRHHFSLIATPLLFTLLFHAFSLMLPLLILLSAGQMLPYAMPYAGAAQEERYYAPCYAYARYAPAMHTRVMPHAYDALSRVVCCLSAIRRARCAKRYAAQRRDGHDSLCRQATYARQMREGSATRRSSGVLRAQRDRLCSARCCVPDYSRFRLLYHFAYRRLPASDHRRRHAACLSLFADAAYHAAMFYAITRRQTLMLPLFRLFAAVTLLRH